MYVRITRIKASSPEELEKARRYFVEKALPAYDGADGFLGGVFHASQEQGTAAGTTMWRDRQSMDSSEHSYTGVVEGVKELGFEVAGVTRAEAVLREQPQPAQKGDWSRVVMVKAPEDKLPGLTEQLKQIVGEMKQLPDFRGMNAAYSREDGILSVLTVWGSREALQADEQRRAQGRPDMIRSRGGEFLGVQIAQVLEAQVKQMAPTS